MKKNNTLLFIILISLMIFIFLAGCKSLFTEEATKKTLNEQL